MLEHFWFLFPRMIEIAMSAVGISATAVLVVKGCSSEGVVTGEEQ